MSVSYERINWEDSPSTATPINAENLNKMDEAISELTNESSNIEDDITNLQADVAEKADPDGTYEELTAGQLASTAFTEDSTPYLYRKTGGDSDKEYVDEIVGGTVVWNQLISNGDFSNGETGWGKHNASVTASDGIYKATKTASDGYCCNRGIEQVKNHKYYKSIELLGANGVSYGFNSQFKTITGNGSWTKVETVSNAASSATAYLLVRANETENFTEISIKSVMYFDLTAMFGTTIADYIYSLEQATEGAGVAFFHKLFHKDYYEYNAGELKSVSGLVSHDTVGFNLWDEEWEVGSIDDTKGTNIAGNFIRSKEFIPISPSTPLYIKVGSNVNMRYFYYDANQKFLFWGDGNNIERTPPENAFFIRFRMYQAYGLTYNHDICINLSDPKRNGEYKPYVKHSYPLDSTVTLRGIPKLDASNNLYYDGDKYLPDGTIERRYGIVDLGTLTWRYNDAQSFFYANIATLSATTKNLMANGYVFVNKSWANMVNSEFGKVNEQNQVRFHNDAYTNAASFKAAISGVMLVYELATPTTETAEPYTQIQKADALGTEEFVLDASAFPVPVGHDTRYPTDLRKKLEEIPLIDPPTANGTYTLKATVSGGTVTYSWVSG